MPGDADHEDGRHRPVIPWCAPPKVFISHSHDTINHQERVLGLADRLRADGIDAEIDQYNAAPPEGWPLWCERKMEAADVVLFVCTETYYRRVGGDEERGKGIVWEARMLRPSPQPIHKPPANGWRSINGRGWIGTHYRLSKQKGAWHRRSALDNKQLHTRINHGGWTLQKRRGFASVRTAIEEEYAICK